MTLPEHLLCPAVVAVGRWCLEDLKMRGVQLLVDDFGTGFSSLSMLHRFPVDVVKIDRSFVSALGSGGRAVDLVGAIISMAASLHLVAVAEGVETIEQAQLLRAAGCSLAQGYLFARPQPAQDLQRLLASGCIRLPSP